jgi:polyisoprenoid-binding protein YceI
MAMRIRLRLIFGTMALFTMSLPAACQASGINAADSKATIKVSKAGLFSAFGHNHVIVAPVAGGKLDRNARTIELTFRTRDMKVMDPDVSEKDRASIDSDMKGEKCLDAQRYPEITFVSRSVDSTDATHFRVRGDLTIHGTTKAVELPVVLAGQRYTSEIKLKQTDFGIQPISAAGGTVKIKDEIQLSFEIVPAP